MNSGSSNRGSMRRWVNLGESLLAVPRPATAYVSQMAHPAIQILPPEKLKSKPGMHQ